MASGQTSTSWITELVDENVLAVYDVALDIKQELQLGSDVIIPIFQPRVRFGQLMPVDMVNLRDRYCELRWKAANLLKARGAVSEVGVLQGRHRWESRLQIAVDGRVFEQVVVALQEEYQRRTTKSQVVSSPVPLPEQSLERLNLLLLRFHSVVVQLRQRHGNRPTIDVTDEYDVQEAK